MVLRKSAVILDTNFLLLYGQEHIDVLTGIATALQEPYEFVVIEPVMQELERLAESNSRDGRAAKLGLAIVQAKLKSSSEPFITRLLFKKEIPLKMVSSSIKYADDAIIAIAEEKPKSIVATLDRGLQRRLLNKDIRIITLKQRGFVLRESKKKCR